MIIYKDRVTGDEFASDTYDLTDINGISGTPAEDNRVSQQSLQKYYKETILPNFENYEFYMGNSNEPDSQ
ncbi:hypothetical protein BDV06DRAFT_229165 [Aspergillus oleicola]